MEERERQFLQLYHEFRVEDYASFFKYRVNEGRKAQRQLGYLAAIMYFLAAGSGICASIDLLGHRGVWAVIGAALAVSIGFLRRYADLFSYREATQLFSEVSQKLLQLSTTSPANNANATSAEVNQYVLSIEKALREEAVDSAQVQNPIPRG